MSKLDTESGQFDLSLYPIILVRGVWGRSQIDRSSTRVLLIIRSEQTTKRDHQTATGRVVCHLH